MRKVKNISIIETEILERGEKSVFESGWYLPHDIKINGKNLIYRIDELTIRKKSVNPDKEPNLLSDFIRLSEEQNGRGLERIVDYARRYGVLGICKHKVPSSHNRPPYMPDFSTDFYDLISEIHEYCRPEKEEIEGHQFEAEPLDAWLSFSREAKAIVQLSSELRGESKGDQKDWQVLDRWTGLHRVPSSIANGKLLLSSVINRWLEMCGVIPQFDWSNNSRLYLSSPSKSPVYTGLPGALVVRLLMLMSQSQRTAFCAGCGKLIFLRQGQNLRLNSYCNSSHCQKAKVAAAARGFYEREKQNPYRKKRKKEKLTNKQIATIHCQWPKWTQSNKPLMLFYRNYAASFGVSERTIRRHTKNAQKK